MNNDDITQKLALLPEGLAEENLRSWQRTVKYYQRLISDPRGSYFSCLFDLVQTISESEQVKLFRAYPSTSILIISTLASERAGEGQGYPFIIVGLKDNILTSVGYYVPTATWEFTECTSNEIAPTLQPLLDRLWNETRGKKNA